MKMPTKLQQGVLVRDRNVIAAACSVVPGLGHIYTGYLANGLILMLLATPLIVWAAVLLSLATAGLGLLVPMLFCGSVGFDACGEEDRRKHHFLDVL